MNFYNVFLTSDGNVKVFDANTGNEEAQSIPADAQNETVANTTQQQTNTEVVPDGGIMSFLPQVLLYGAVFVAMYFFFIRQPRKEQKAKEELRQSIKIGDSVLTTSGIYGKIVDIGEDLFALELGNNRSIVVYIRKEAVEGVTVPVMTPANTESSK